MRKTITLLIALCFSLIGAYAQLGPEYYSQNTGINTFDSYSSFNDGSQFTSKASADDFIVPAGETWDIEQVTGTFISGSHSNFTVKFYENMFDGLSRDFIPGTEIASYSVAGTVGSDLGGCFMYTINLPSTASLTQGTYWISIAANDVSGEWTNNGSYSPIGTAAKTFSMISGWEAPMVMVKNLNFSLHGIQKDNDLYVDNITSPLSGELTNAETVSIIIGNSGLVTQSSYSAMYQVSKTVNNELVLVYESADIALTTDIAAGETFEYSFDTKVDLSEITTYSVLANVSLIGDEKPDNNTFAYNVTNTGPSVLMGDVKEITACDIKFFDDGGVDGNFSKASRDTITFYPTTEGDRISIEMTFIERQSGYLNGLYFYDGETVDAPLILKHNSNTLPTEPFLSRNSSGAITVFADVNKDMQDGPSDYAGWEMFVSCFTPSEIDFSLTEAFPADKHEIYQIGNESKFLSVIKNIGANTVSRDVYLLENDAKIDTLTTLVLAPGEIDTLVFTYAPKTAADSTNLKIMIQDDPQDTNEDNVFETYFAVYDPANLIESFESEEKIIPEYWLCNESVTTINSASNSPQGGYYLKTKGANDTVITPIIKPEAGDLLKFFVKVDAQSSMSLLYSSNAKGPWELLKSYAPEELESSWQELEFNLGGFTDTAYYFAFAMTNPGKYDYVSLDFVRGGKLHYYENDLMAVELNNNNNTITNKETLFKATVRNVGTNNIVGEDYIVELKDTLGTVLAISNGVDILSMEEGIVTINHTFTTTDTLPLYANIVMTGELRTDNNTSDLSFIKIQNDSTYISEINGESGNDVWSNPIAAKKMSALTEMIYYPSEVQFAGDLSGIEFYYKISAEATDLPVNIYVGTIQDSTLVAEDGSVNYIPADSLNITKVFEGTVTLAESADFAPVFIEFDNSFNYNGIDNLIVIVHKDSSDLATQTAKFQSVKKPEETRLLAATVGAYDVEQINFDPNDPHKEPSIKSGYILRTSFHFTNNNAPKISTEPVLMVGQGMEYSYEIEMQGGLVDSLTIGAYIMPEWLTLARVDDTIATLSGTTNNIGTYDVQLMVTDGFYPTTQTYAISVEAVPEFTSTPDTIVNVSSAYAYNIAVSYDSETFVAITGTDLPAWLTLTDNGDNTASLTGTSPNTEEIVEIKLKAEGEYYSSEQVYKLYIGSVPVFTSTSDTLIMVGDNYAYSINVNYESSSSVVITGTNLPTWLVLTDNGDNTASLTGTAPATEAMEVITLTATGTLHSAQQVYNLHVGAEPVFTSTPDTTLIANSTYTYNISVDYSSEAFVSITAIDLPAWLTLTDNGDNTATLTGTTDVLGINTIELVAKGAYYNAEQTYNLDIISGINDDLKTSINVYPNPANNYITVTNANNATVSLIDLSGRLHSIEEVNSAEHKINVSNMNSGVYIIKIEHDDYTKNQRIIIE